MQTVFVLVVVGPHDGCGFAGIEVHEFFADTYAVEAPHLESLMHNVHALKAVGYCDVTGDPAVMCAGLRFTQLSGMAGISPARGYAEREAAYFSEHI